MSRKSKSQWEFGELFTSEPARVILTVSELTVRVRRLLEQQFSQVTVAGEVSNLRLQSSGHVYFTLKDERAQLSCVLFRGTAVQDRAFLRDGQKLVVQGDLTVYEPRGQYQLVVRQLELHGIGVLQLAFERLKRRLDAEGWFAAERKRRLSRFPRRIGLVTSPTGAAIRDVLHVIQRRNPTLGIVFVPCRVQGEGAALEIAAAIGQLNAWARSGDVAKPLDLILVTRGGGSLEDLWAFNEEVVARAIYESILPVVSAVGHEIDFTISDFVADVRAATPSAAAELITEGVFACRPWLSALPARLRQLAGRRVASADEALAQFRQRLAYLHPRRRLNQRLQFLDDLQADMARRAAAGLRRRELVWRQAAVRLLAVKPGRRIHRLRQDLAVGLRRLQEAGRSRMKDLCTRLAGVGARLRLLSPEHVLERGYSITTDAGSGRVLRRALEIAPGQRLRTRLQHGSVESVVAVAEEGRPK